jgi:hypothetical protein
LEREIERHRLAQENEEAACMLLERGESMAELKAELELKGE